MTFYIPFRSRYAHHSSADFSRIKKNFSGTDWSHIIQYDDHSDAKNIIWKKSTNPNFIYQKKHENTSQISLLFCNIQDESDFFQENPSDTNRNIWKKESLKILEKNAKYLKIPHQILHFHSLLEFSNFIQKQKIKNTMILIFANNFHENSINSLKKIAKTNECIWIHGYHPFEKNPHQNILFSGKIFHKKLLQKYLYSLEKHENLQKNLLNKIQIPTIFTEINIPIERTLYHFFKYQYE